MAKLGPSLWDDPNYVLGSIIPRNKGFDLGSAELPFRTLYVENAVPVGANLHLTGTLEVDGASILNSTLAVGGAVSVASLTSAGNVVINGTLGVPGSILGGALNISGTIASGGDISITGASPGATLTISNTGGGTSSSGTFIADGTNQVVIPTTQAQGAMAVIFGMNSPAGTPTQYPNHVDTDPGVDFTVVCGAGDTSVYNWIIIKTTT